MTVESSNGNVQNAAVLEPGAPVYTVATGSPVKPPSMADLRAQLNASEIDEDKFLDRVADIFESQVHTEIASEEADESFVREIPIAYARRYNIIALQSRDGVLPIITSDPIDLYIFDYIGLLLCTPIVIELAPATVVRAAINHAYAEQDADFDGVLENVSEADSEVEYVELNETGDLLDNAAHAPVIRLVNMMLSEAVKRRASDVHIHPLGDAVKVRYRIDGVLYDHTELPAHLLDEVVSRVKIIGKMDIAEKRLAQDGRTSVVVGDKSIDLRISVIPTSYGERVVLRLLDKSTRLLEMVDLGMSEPDQRRFEKLIQHTHGIILVTGPTGSGKSTTLYAALQYLDCTEKNILTLEDPIEYRLPGISQTQVSNKKGMTFATGLRAVLRQDPDVIMVGEIRDEETARMAIQSSLTGHLVFSTLHTNDAAGAVTRLLDLGIEPYLVASSLLACLAQRLVRVVCPHCCEERELTESLAKEFQLDAGHSGRLVKQAVGCDRCSSTGYLDRRGVFELLEIDEEIRELVVSRAKASAIAQCAVRGGMTSLRQDAIRKVLIGETTADEVARVTQSDVVTATETLN